MYVGILIGSALAGAVLTRLGAPELASTTAAVAALGALTATRSTPHIRRQAAEGRARSSRPSPDQRPRQPLIPRGEDRAARHVDEARAVGLAQVICTDAGWDAAESPGTARPCGIRSRRAVLPRAGGAAAHRRRQRGAHA